MTNLKFEIFINDKEPANEYQPKIGDKMAKIYTKDGSYNTLVQSDKYGEYIVVPNYLNTRDDITVSTFSYRLKDAIETIRNGDGDVFTAGNMFGSKYISMHFYLDRKTGEELRAKSLEGWKDTEFEISVFYPGSFGGCYLCSNDNNSDYNFVPAILLDELKNEKKIVFESEEEAEKLIQQIYDKCEEIIKSGDFGGLYLDLIDDDENDPTGFTINKRLRVVQELKK